MGFGGLKKSFGIVLLCSLLKFILSTTGIVDGFYDATSEFVIEFTAILP